MTRRIAWIVAALCLAPSAFAATVEVKAAKGVEKHEPVGEATEFAVKDTVWVWTRVTDGDGTTIKHEWKRDGKEEWSTELPVRSTTWVTHSRRMVEAGSYTVEILAGDGSKLAEVAFTVK